MSDWQNPWMVWIGARSKALKDSVRCRMSSGELPGAASRRAAMTRASSPAPGARPSEIAWAADTARRSAPRSRSRNSAVAAWVKVLTRIWSTRRPRSISNLSQSRVME